MIDERAGFEKIIIKDYKGNYINLRTEINELHVHINADMHVETNANLYIHTKESCHILADKEMNLEVHIKSVDYEPGKVVIVGDANLWKGDARIYEVTDLAVALED